MARTPQPAAPATKAGAKAALPAADGKAASPERPAPTRFACLAPAAHAVYLAGTFNGWDPKATPMSKDAGGNWGVAVILPPGRYEFKFVVDGAWCCEPGCDETNHDCPKCVPNPFGTMNRVIDVA